MASSTASNKPPGNSRFKALALDLDGTLLDPEACLVESATAPLRRLIDQGFAAYLVSGRMLPAIEPYWRELGLDTPVVGYNGAKIAVPGKPALHEAALDPPTATATLEACRARGYHVNLYLDDGLYVLEAGPVARWYAAHYRVPLQTISWERACASASTKLLVIVDEAVLPQAHQDLNEAVGEGATVTTSSRHFVEVLPRGTSKGWALQFLAEKTGVPLEHWVAVGDGGNDVEMIQAAGLGLAISNGHPNALGAAAHHIPPLFDGGMEPLLALMHTG